MSAWLVDVPEQWSVQSLGAGTRGSPACAHQLEPRRCACGATRLRAIPMLLKGLPTCCLSNASMRVSALFEQPMER